MSAYPTVTHTDPSTLDRKDLKSEVEVRWCPGCGDYAILNQVQRALAGLGIPKENFVVVSGIGCSSRFPYYMETYGMHTIHGRAPAIASGVKLANPDLDVWVMTGDGDALSIGGNHLIHALRRNISLKIVMFNNRIYGLTKGQYSPTSEQGKKTKSSPAGSVDRPFNPVALALGAGASFVARSIDSDGKHMQAMLQRMAAHKGSAFLEIYQSCVIFNPNAFTQLGDKKTRADAMLTLEDGKPLRFGAKNEKGIALDANWEPQVVDAEAAEPGQLLVHNEKNATLAGIVSHLDLPSFPVPMGVFRDVEDPVYEEGVTQQIRVGQAKDKRSVQEILEAGETWSVN